MARNSARIYVAGHRGMVSYKHTAVHRKYRGDATIQRVENADKKCS